MNFPFICSNIPASRVYGVYISQPIRYSGACAQYSDFLYRAQLLTQKVLKQVYVAPRLMSSLQKLYVHQNLIDSLYVDCVFPLSLWSTWVHPQLLVGSVLLIFLVFRLLTFVLFVFVLCLMYTMLPVSLDCPFLTALRFLSRFILQIYVSPQHSFKRFIHQSLPISEYTTFLLLCFTIWNEHI